MIMARWARVHQRAGEPRRALRITTSGRKLLAASPSQDSAAATVKLDVLMASVRLEQEKPREARKWALQAASGARRADDLESLARALSMIDHADWQRGLPIPGHHIQEALEIYTTIGDLVGQAIARQQLGVLAFDAGRWVDALNWYESSRLAALKAGMDYGAAETELNIVEILINQGQLDDAQVVLHRAMRVLRASGVEYSSVFGTILQARLHLACGRLAEAEEQAVQSIADARALGSQQSAFEASLVRAEVAIRRGAPEDGLRIAVEAERGALAEGTTLQAQLHLVRAGALLDLNRLQEADQEASLALKSAVAQHLPFEEARSLAIRASVAQRRGDVSAASADLALAGRLLSEMGVTTPADAASRTT
jgi:tetratricopeptide (TPR) repeat protein